jgi:hypothetical protein
MANHLNKNLPYILDSIFGDRGRKAPLLVLYSALAMKVRLYCPRGSALNGYVEPP